MSQESPKTLFAGFRVTSLATLISRVLGLSRDIATASLFGVSGSVVMDAFVVAFRIPNLFRRLFGEGALMASYLPVISQRLEDDRESAQQVASATLVLLVSVLAVIVIAGELVCGGLLVFAESPSFRLLLQLMAIMLPFVLFISVTAQFAATLHAMSHFTAPAFASCLLNLCWLAATGIAVWISADSFVQAYVLATAIVIAGLLQLLLQGWMLYRLGFHWSWNWQRSRIYVDRVVATMAPAVAGLAVTQINTVFDCLIAWGFAAPLDSPASLPKIPWLDVPYPMQNGAAAATYFGERMYMFPLGLIGIATATVIFPLLSHHAARGKMDRLAEDLTTGLRLVLFLGIPASVGLWFFASPIVELLFEHGEFSSHDTRRTAAIIQGYAIGIWAFCAVPVLVRAYYALGDLRTPFRVGCLVVAINLILSLALIWSLAEVGLAVATALTSAVQIGLLVTIFSRQKVRILWQPLIATVFRVGIASAGMALMAVLIHRLLEPFHAAISLPCTLLGCVILYLLLAQMVGAQEIGELLSGIRRKKTGSTQA